MKKQYKCILYKQIKFKFIYYLSEFFQIMNFTIVITNFLYQFSHDYFSIKKLNNFLKFHISSNQTSREQELGVKIKQNKRKLIQSTSKQRVSRQLRSCNSGGRNLQHRSYRETGFQDRIRFKGRWIRKECVKSPRPGPRLSGFYLRKRI